MTDTKKPMVGFIGLGAMGMGMARSILEAGLPLKGYDIRPEAVQALTQAGGQGVDSAAAAAEGAEVLLLIVVNSDQAESVLFGEGRAAEALPKGSLVMLCSTVRASYARQTAARLAEMGLEMLDAPVSGGTVRAGEGTLSVMASGSPAAFAQAEPVLAAIAANVYRLGDECGRGSTMKMVNQLLCGVHIAAAAEALAIGVKAGIDPETIYEVITHSAGASWMFENRVPHMLDGDYTPYSAVEIFVKDLGIVLDTGHEERFPTPQAAAAHQLFLMASATGLGRLDDSAVVKVFEQLAGIDVRRKED